MASCATCKANVSLVNSLLPQRGTVRWGLIWVRYKGSRKPNSSSIWRHILWRVLSGFSSTCELKEWYFHLEHCVFHWYPWSTILHKEIQESGVWARDFPTTLTTACWPNVVETHLSDQNRCLMLLNKRRKS